MKILFIGDIFGRPGRDAVAKYVPILRAQHKPDFVIANADNASHGTGVTPVLAKELYDMGVDLLTGGDHVWDQKDMVAHLDRSPWVLRPLNYPVGTPGKGVLELATPQGAKLAVVHLQGRIFMDGNSLADNAFTAIEHWLQRNQTKHVLIDFHAEATSEKMAMAHFVNGRVTAVIGTHTHVPTADARILDKGTAIMTDVGMTGDTHSIIGADYMAPMQKFVTGIRHQRLQPATGEATLCAVLITSDDATGLATAIEPIQIRPAAA
jgi:metallophosphoesterase (TIGR00282 family)